MRRAKGQAYVPDLVQQLAFYVLLRGWAVGYTRRQAWRVAGSAVVADDVSFKRVIGRST